MSSAKNLQIAAAFRGARQRLVDGEENYICHAISEADQAGLEAIDVISERLGGRAMTLFSWLVAKGHMSNEELGMISDKKRREFRINWLDALIKEFES